MPRFYLLCLIIFTLVLTSCRKHHRYYLKLDNTYGLKQGDVVIIKGIRIGRVDKVDLKGNDVIAQFYTDDKYQIYQADSIYPESIDLLGTKAIIVKRHKINDIVLADNSIIKGNYGEKIIKLNFTRTVMDTIPPPPPPSKSSTKP